ncbi:MULTISPECIES: RNA ligase RtcB family protein [unclassified Novosphingobium]|uniref:RNA ligase RtcB family protein n=1 Tax=unclassified Novosphingobium TaxID=2644732 RepID=UPI00146A3695|nr:MULTISPECIES: RNA ligase RtcB family protein [unclassified Novosphingobium]NMN05453.1 release factor H-coupled RctB family protein [Novosphingobium sp. SG919]NMN88188.1 release factor H-coupled RctB family protein [Novosphingobium sp. SG916]
MSPIALIARDPSRFDPLALDQLAACARYDGMARIVGLPDLHAGNGIAVGAAFWSPSHVWPHLVGSDIGCGMALWETDCPLRKFRLGSVERKLHGLDAPWAGDHAAALAEAGLPPHLASPALGTIGGGNHFVEFQRVEAVVDEARFAALGLRQDRVWMMVHSGSRGLGQAILQAHRQADAHQGIPAGRPEAEAYLADHDAALGWAILNRQVIARRFCESLGFGGRRVLDICHNSVTPHQGGWLHRKGAAPADRGLVTIPGSRGDFSYLVEPVAEGADHALHSLAHGAGRKWSRKDAHARLSRRFKVADLQRTALGSQVICEDRRLIFEEAPEAYKDIGMVIADLELAGLIRVIAQLRPLLSYKTRAA